MESLIQEDQKISGSEQQKNDKVKADDSGAEMIDGQCTRILTEQSTLLITTQPPIPVLSELSHPETPPSRARPPHDIASMGSRSKLMEPDAGFKTQDHLRNVGLMQR